MTEETLFHLALQKPAAQRIAFLDEACAGDDSLRRRVQALLDAHLNPGSFLQQPPVELGLTALPLAAGEDSSSLAEGPGSALGPYKLLQQIGEGGMGTVFMAEQTQPVQRKVALKIIKPGMDRAQVIARFEAERQALALMDHPSIAKVLDADTTDNGRPYFVMELVKGMPITKFCDQRHLTPRERLELFIPVCQAVQHAHQKGIIHRDLKPSNVLIALYDGKPVPKVIDFGIAKATGPKLTERTLFTEFGQVVGTLEYMSPEQAELNQLDIDTRSDIYSLGVLLYELLTGTTPLEKKRLKEAAILEVLRLIREEEPPKPSTRLSTTDELPTIAASRGTEPKKLSGLVKGELDWIVMKCLEKDRGRRYESASALAQDLRRYLQDEPVQACPPSIGYQVRKFVRRNRRGLVTAVVLGAALLVAVLAVGGSVGWTIRDDAARRAEAVRDARTNMSHEMDWAERMFGEGKRLEAVAAWGRADRLGDKAGPVSELRDRLADLKRRLDAAEQDEEFVAGFEMIRQTDGPWGSDSMHARGWIRRKTGSELGALFKRYGIEPGVTPPEQAAARIRGRPPAVQERVLSALVELSWGIPEDEPAGRQWVSATLEATDRDGWRQKVQKARMAEDYPSLERNVEEPDAARQPRSFLASVADTLCRANRKAGFDLFQRLYTEDPSDFWVNMDYGMALARVGRPGEGLRHVTAAVALQPLSPGVHHNRGFALEKLGEVDAALAAYRRAAELGPRYSPPHGNMGTVFARRQQWDEALAAYRRAIERHPENPKYHYGVYGCYARQGRYDLALPALRKVIALDEAYPMAYHTLGSALEKTGDHAGAIEAFRRALEVDRPPLVETHFGLGNALRRTGDPDGALKEYRQVIAIDPNHAKAHHNLALTLLAKKDRKGAAVALQRAVELGLGEEFPEVYYELGFQLHATGDHLGAITAYRRAIELGFDTAVVHTNLGRALRATGDKVGALAEFRRAVEVEPKSAAAHSDLGEFLRLTGERDEALRALEHAILLDPKSAMAHLRLGLVLQDLKKRDDAMAAFQKAIKLDSTLPDAHAVLGVVFAEQGKWADAIAAFKDALKHRPNDVQANRSLAHLLTTCPDAALHDPELAATTARQLIALGAESTGWMYLGMAHYRGRDYKSSLEALEKSVALAKPAGAVNPTQCFFLAMAHEKLKNSEEARKWYNRIVKVLDQQKTTPEDLRRLRAEAAELLGINEPTPK